MKPNGVFRDAHFFVVNADTGIELRLYRDYVYWSGRELSQCDRSETGND